jgi:cobyrinic acid a,c-diamide synthase
MNGYPRIIITGLRGGSGKTIVSLAMTAAFVSAGRNVIPFKKGPDYIDAGWLAKAAGSPCYNLDLFIMTPDQAFASFMTHAGKDVLSLIEGNRGLYDGVDAGGTFSTAELAKMLRAPVVIVVDCTKATTTVAAMILGCMKMDPDVRIGGVVLNRVATGRQESVIRDAIREICGVPVLGAVPRLKDDPFPERHMGLIPYHEHGSISSSIESIKDVANEYLDLDALLRVATSGGALTDKVRPLFAGDKKGEAECQPCPRIGVIRDSVFQFYYEENFEALVNLGAELVEVSPLAMRSLPEIDALYIGGGFPETHALSLVENSEFRDSLVDMIERGLPVYAECGGLMYLGQKILIEGKEYPMAGVLPLSFGMGKRPSAHGYTIVETSGPNPYFREGVVLKGHEFHYSHVTSFDGSVADFAFTVRRGRGILDNKDGLCYKNVLAAYTHLHAAGSPEWAHGVIKAARKFMKDRSR